MDSIRKLLKSSDAPLQFKTPGRVKHFPEGRLKLPLGKILSDISKALKTTQYQKDNFFLKDKTIENLKSCAKSLQGSSIDRIYRRLLSIDPHLVNEKRSDETNYWIVQKIKSLYFAIKKLFTSRSSIDSLEGSIAVLTSLLEMNQEAKKVVELFPKFFTTKNPISTLDEVHEELALCEACPTLLERKKWFEDYLRLSLSSDIDYLLDPQLSLIVNPLLDSARSIIINNCSLGIASYSENSACASATFPNQKHLKSSVPFYLGMIDDSAPHMQKWRNVGVSKNVQMLPTNHCAHTNEWRKKLIQAAEHNIVISGNYCDGKAFDEVLELIKERLEKKPKLKVVIMLYPVILKENKKKGIRNISLISKLQGDYPTRFSVVHSDRIEINGGGDGFKTATNHVKYTGIDFGRYYITGGSGIKDNFDLSGVDNPFELLEEDLKKAFALLNARLIEIKEGSEGTTTGVMCSWIEEAKAFSLKLRQSPHYSPKDFKLFFKVLDKNIDLLSNSQGNPPLYTDKRDQLVVNGSHDTGKTKAVDSGIMGFLLPGNFRDMDFVFKDPNDGYSSGRQLFLETVRLAYRWEALNEGRDKGSKVPGYTPKNIANLPIFTGAKAVDVILKNTVVQRIMHEPMPLVNTLNTSEVEGFEGVEKGNIEMIYQGPESPTGRSSIAEKALNLISNARDRIVFNHMYFAPTEEIVLALKDAAERGVKIEIITTAVTKNCPRGQLAFGPYNHWHWSYLVAKVTPEAQKNIEIYAYQQKTKGLHKKVIVVDDTVLAGSSNFGFKSLVTSSDHEFNFLAKSLPFAERTLAICEEDKARSIKIDGKMGLRPHQYFSAVVYSLSKHLTN